MPTYEYVCVNGHKHDRYGIKAEDRKPRPCPECLQEATRIVSPALRPIVKGGTKIFHS